MASTKCGSYVIFLLAAAVVLLLNAGCSTTKHEVRLWQGSVNAQIIWKADQGQTGKVTAAAINPDATRIAIGRDDGRILLWAPRAAQPERSFPAKWNWVSDLAYSPDGKLLASASLNQPERAETGGGPVEAASVRLLDLFQNVERDILTPEPPNIEDCRLRFSPDSAWLAMHNPARTVVVNTTTLLPILNFGGEWGRPLFFTTAEGSLQFLARERQWEIRDSRAIQNQGITPRAIDAISPDGKVTFTSVGPIFASEGFILYPGLLLGEGGIAVGSPDFPTDNDWLVLKDRMDWSVRSMEYLPATAQSVDRWLIASMEYGGGQDFQRDIVAINLETKHYQSLIPPGWAKNRWLERFAFSVSPEQRAVVVAGNPGCALWQLPGRQR